jgi:uncharacterized protein (DUF1697 family)
MADLRRCLEEAGFTDVATHLATGNVLLTTSLRSRGSVESRLEEVFEQETGFEVPTVVLTPRELAAVCSEASTLGAHAARRYVTFLKAPLPAAAAREVDAWDAPGEGAKALDRAVCWWIDHPSQAARFSNARIERYGAVATTRDLKVVTTIAQKWQP